MRRARQIAVLWTRVGVRVSGSRAEGVLWMRNIVVLQEIRSWSWSVCQSKVDRNFGSSSETAGAGGGACASDSAFPMKQGVKQLEDW